MEAKLDIKRAKEALEAGQVRPEALPTTLKGITIRGLRAQHRRVSDLCSKGRFRDDQKFTDGTFCKGTMDFEEAREGERGASTTCTWC